MTGFDPDWLALREPADQRARDSALAHDFIHHLTIAPDTPCRLVDLGGGTGANLRLLAPLIKGDQQWLLIDWDADLLQYACRAISDWARHLGFEVRLGDSFVDIQTDNARWHVTTRTLDLAKSLESVDLHDFDGVVTTAFLDLVSAPWLDRLADWLAHSQRPLLATLTVDGRRHWRPSHPHDDLIQAAFRAHQGADKGFGDSLGPAATDDLAGRLSARGYTVHAKRSDWQLDNDCARLLQTLLRDEAAVALEVYPDAQMPINEWLRARTAQINASELSLQVGHQDLLALPR